MAAHIVANDAALQQELSEAIRHIKEGEPDDRRAEAIQRAIEQIATRALDTGGTPKLFGTTWRSAWRETSSEDPETDDTEGRFFPKADDAVRVLDAVLEGRIRGPLERETRITARKREDNHQEGVKQCRPENEDRRGREDPRKDRMDEVLVSRIRAAWEARRSRVAPAKPRSTAARTTADRLQLNSVTKASTADAGTPTRERRNPMHDKPDSRPDRAAARAVDEGAGRESSESCSASSVLSLLLLATSARVSVSVVSVRLRTRFVDILHAHANTLAISADDFEDAVDTRRKRETSMKIGKRTRRGCLGTGNTPLNRPQRIGEKRSDRCPGTRSDRFK